MAQTLYETRRFQDLPFLGDALEEAGCVDEGILAHCRRTTDWDKIGRYLWELEHVRGCWVLDLILGRT
ncbi:MAG TPA: hypothetical protein VEL76_35760 [Gemmataceae bacterium]|nr:hypothetical protein [Gemmataceae bacterium]